MGKKIVSPQESVFPGKIRSFFVLLMMHFLTVNDIQALLSCEMKCTKNMSCFFQSCPSMLCNCLSCYWSTRVINGVEETFNKRNRKRKPEADDIL